MPNIKSAIKRVEVAERNRLRNKTVKSAIRTRRNEVEEAVKSADAKNAQAALKNAYRLIDKAVSKGILHKNTAARRKSRLAQQVLHVKATKKGK
ncbi:MAG TPA: 30S ribosomal protein S20 [Planktothrix sp.]